MVALAPDLLADTRLLSVSVTATGLVLGLALWVLGWRAHRFWIVLAATLGGGIAGLAQSPAYGVQPLVAGLLAAVAAGVLALALVRVVAFVAGAIAALLVTGAFLHAWDQPLVTALAGGLVGVALFRLWTMALTSALGTLLALYSALSLLDRLGTLNCVSFAEANAVLLNWLSASLMLVGLLTQFLLERRKLQKERKKEEAARAKAAEEEEKKKRKAAPPPPPPPSFWGTVVSSVKRMAG
jgi:signal transduction histidine kinase